MKHKALKLAIAGALAFLIGFLSSIKSAPAQQRFDLKVRNDFFAGFAGDKAALARGMKACEEVLAADPTNAEAMVWHGSGVLVGGAGPVRRGRFREGDAGVDSRPARNARRRRSGAG